MLYLSNTFIFTRIIFCIVTTPYLHSFQDGNENITENEGQFGHSFRINDGRQGDYNFSYDLICIILRRILRKRC